MTFDMQNHIQHSNWIESVNGDKEVRQSLLAWEFLLAQPMPLTKADILETHKIIMWNFPPPRSEPGRFREINVEVLPQQILPFYADVPDLIDEWLNEMREYTSYDPKQAHIDFEHIHPFRDGNGRTGRMLMWRHEIANGFEPTLFTYKSRFAYYSWF